MARSTISKRPQPKVMHRVPPSPKQETLVSPQSTSMMGGVASTVLQGASFGAGSSLGHRLVEGVLGHSGEKNVTLRAPDVDNSQKSCDVLLNTLSQCIMAERQCDALQQTWENKCSGNTHL